MSPAVSILSDAPTMMGVVGPNVQIAAMQTVTGTRFR